ncbi:hypothetical protein [Litchfieldella xinjiangensis]|uniref:hypothetical protein n=1 Tax=Litchfieldella xinjiangensis TaxID=1166948 RepID=UPI0005B95D36|nr:hypothetical protein [Halomonas xinjiangensis]
MANSLALARRVETSRAIAKLRRLGATSCEPAWLKLWGFGLAQAGDSDPLAWLLTGQDLSRALLLPGGDFAVGDALSAGEAVFSDELRLDDEMSPQRDDVARQWLWERLAKPRLWHTRLILAEPTPVWLPLWLGYRHGRHHRLVIVSGMSGEPLVRLKPAVLAGLAKRHAEGEGAARRA